MAIPFYINGQVGPRVATDFRTMHEDFRVQEAAVTAGMGVGDIRREDSVSVGGFARFTSKPVFGLSLRWNGYQGSINELVATGAPQDLSDGEYAFGYRILLPWTQVGRLSPALSFGVDVGAYDQQPFAAVLANLDLTVIAGIFDK